MGRLTKHGKTSHENGICCTHFNGKECMEVQGNCAFGCKWEEEVWSKLAKYEDLEEQGRLIKLPISVENVIDKLFSHNEIVALWCKVEKDVTYHKLVWRGMAWDIPKKFKSCGFVKFFGTIPQNISQADTINIEVLLTEEAEKALEMEK